MSPSARKSRRPTRCRANWSASRWRFVQAHAVYVPLGHRAGDGLDLGGEGEVEQMPMREALDLLKPSAGRRERAQDRAERQIRHGGARPLRHRARPASTIPASCPMRSTPAAPSICRSSLPARSSATPASPQKEIMGSGRAAVDLRARAGRPRHRICRRGGRYRPAALARAEAAADRRACRPPSTRPWSGRSRRCSR